MITDITPTIKVGKPKPEAPRKSHAESAGMFKAEGITTGDNCGSRVVKMRPKTPRPAPG